jgi:hypothetical protein
LAVIIFPRACKCRCKGVSEKSKSPDRRYEAVLEVAGQIECGPPYFYLKIDNLNFGKRVFGDAYLWSGDSAYFIIQEWLTTCYQTGPKTALTLFDLSNRKECLISWADKGFIAPLFFDGGALIYKKEYLDKGIAKEFEIDFHSLDRWEEIKAVSHFNLADFAYNY